MPRYVGGWDLLAALTPEPLMALARTLIGDDRALDPEARSAYTTRVAAQVTASGRSSRRG
ncbi:hypothetical protein SAMN04489732_12264 [Amycolatopsis saalfeldensis]|uniref:Uncharacterized protein n=1 Tax=Amycolatopsis saalfeldensis TaxID=394193 RepID=A0A1H8YKW6_9PSEU|nr:hypothetical protein SAMN04489732_12264 [Amycolatopsis saalfeldensis]